MNGNLASALDKAWDSILNGEQQLALEHLHGACKEVAGILQDVTAADIASVRELRRELSQETASRVIAERTLEALARWTEIEFSVRLAEFPDDTPPGAAASLLRTTAVPSAFRKDDAAVLAALQWSESAGKSDPAVVSILSLHRQWCAGGRVSENDGDVAARILAGEVMRLRRLTECPFRSDAELAEYLNVPLPILRRWTDAQVIQAHGWKRLHDETPRSDPPEHYRPFVK